MEQIGVIILAAGNSERFNYPKALLAYDREKTFLEKIILEYVKFSCNEIIVVLNENTIKAMEESMLERIKDNVRIITNKHPDYGRFYSLQLGANAISEPDFCFMQNVDNPFVDKTILEPIFSERLPDGYTVPFCKNKGGHPVLLSRMILNEIKKEKNIESNIKEYLTQFKKKSVDTDNEIVLVNINTPEDYKKFLKKDCEEHLRRNIIHL